MTSSRLRTRALGAVALAAALLAPVGTSGAVPAPPPTETGAGGGRVDVEIDAVSPDRFDELVRAVRAHGGIVTGRVPGALVQASLPASALDALGAHPAGRGLREPRRVGLVPSNGLPAAAPAMLATTAHLDATGAGAWHAAGLQGSGVKVGIIDYFDASTWASAIGVFPGPSHRRCRDVGQDCDALFEFGMSGGEHGVAVAEALLSMAPGVEVFIGAAGTTADTQAIVDWFVANGVRIIVRSLADFYDGPGDGRGPLAAVVESATSRGVVWVNAAGNQGVDAYYRGPAKDSNGNGVIEFGPGADEFLRIDGCVVLGGLRWHTDWDVPPSQRQDYDLYVYSAPTTDGTPVVDLDAPTFVSDLDQRGRFGPAQDPLEGAGAELLCPPVGHSHYVRVERFAGPPDPDDVLELLVYAVAGTASVEYVSSVTPASHSATTPVVDSRSRSLLAVGATTTPGGTEIAAYSNRGPTNDGRLKPEMVAPACLASSIYTPCFAGTSAAAPLVAGAGALLLQAGMAAPGRPLAAALKHRTLDLPPAGPDLSSGWGVLRLGPPPAAAVDSSPGRYTPLAVPRRVLDTRPATAVGGAPLVGELAVDEIRTLRVTGAAGVPATGVSAVAVNLTTVSPRERGYVQAVPARVRGAALGGSSNLNVDRVGRTVANFAIVPVGPDGSIDLYTASGGHLVVDVLGWFGPSGPTSPGRFVGIDPVRALDTRPGARLQVPPEWPAGRVPTSGDSIRVRAPAAAGLPGGDAIQALVLNVTATGATSTAVVQAYPTGAAGVVGATSTLNLAPGRAVANTVIVPVGTDGTASLYLEALGGGRAHLIADVTGYITGTGAPSATAGRFVPVGPGRVLDSRATGGIFGANEVRTQQVVGVPGPRPAVPAGATAVALNLTVTGSQAIGYLSAWPAGAPIPATSSLNWPGAGSTVANASVVKLSTGGALSLLSSTNATTGPLAHHLVDVFGWFTG